MDTDSQSSENPRVQILLARRQEITEALASQPYNLVLYLERAAVYSDLAYPDLAAGDAYRALLLCDEVLNEGFEYSDQASESLRAQSLQHVLSVLQHGRLSADLPAITNGDTGHGPALCKELAKVASVRCFQILSLNLLLCGCLKSACEFCDRGLVTAPQNEELLETKGYIQTVAKQRLRTGNFTMKDLPEQGLVRREIYPWNAHEPDRFSSETLAMLNEDLARFAPKCVIDIAKLPVLLDGESNTDGYDIIPTCHQLGVFAKEDIAAGEKVLEEYSLLTASNRFKEPVCDACSGELPGLGQQQGPVSCSECHDTVFCSEYCHAAAQELYHPAVCDKDVDSIAKDPDPREADETLHLLLLARVLALSSRQEIHPLQVRQIKYLWGDFVPSITNEIDLSPRAEPPPEWTLPFSFKYNIETPLHILEKMDVDIFATLAEHDIWVFNTLYGKFRGTASARKNPRDGKPDVAAVHPLWCLANHDCDPNVTWEWGGRMVLKAREERVVGGRPGGIEAGQEILNHYCDVTLTVKERREWAKGSLGGWCMCGRCRNEATGGAKTLQ